MKKILLLASFFSLVLALSLQAQAPHAIQYQTIIRNAAGEVVMGQSVSLQLTIRQTTANGTSVYQETHSASTNGFGLVNLQIGTGTSVSGTFSGIDWSMGPYYLEVGLDLMGSSTYTVMGTTQLLSVPYALYAETAGPTYSVGDFAHGGIVFWVDESGKHGLVCSKEDQSTGTRWYAGTFGVTRATGDGPFSGELNTAIIISAQVSIGDDGNPYAAQICNDLQIAEGGKTYGDWYLPSKEELNLMYQNRVTINATATANSGSAFSNTIYWSSTEFDNTRAWDQDFDNGGQANFTKDYHLNRVRAIRAF